MSSNFTVDKSWSDEAAFQDWKASSGSALEWGVDAFNSIQSAITKAESISSESNPVAIHIAAGEYKEALAFNGNGNITLQGAADHGTILTGWILGCDKMNAMTNVTISGLSIVGATQAQISAGEIAIAQIAGKDIPYHGVIWSQYQGSNLQILDNKITASAETTANGNGVSGVRIEGISGVVVRGNEINVAGKIASGIAISGGSNPTSPILVTGVTISDNIITAEYDGINLSNNQVTGNITISGNTVNSAGSCGIAYSADQGTAVISGNTIYNSASDNADKGGITIKAAQTGTLELSGNKIGEDCVQDIVYRVSGDNITASGNELVDSVGTVIGEAQIIAPPVGLIVVDASKTSGSYVAGNHLFTVGVNSFLTVQDAVTKAAGTSVTIDMKNGAYTENLTLAGSNLTFADGQLNGLIQATDSDLSLRNMTIVYGDSSLAWNEWTGSAIRGINGTNGLTFGTVDAAFRMRGSASTAGIRGEDTRSVVIDRLDSAMDIAVGGSKVYGIVSNGSVSINTIGSKTDIAVNAYNGNSAYGIYAAGDLTIGSVEKNASLSSVVQYSHTSYALFSNSILTITGDMGGTIYAQAGNANGEEYSGAVGVFGVNGVKTGSISGSITAKTWRDKGSQTDTESGGSKQYFAAGIFSYGDINAGKRGEAVALTGTITAEAGTSGAFGVLAGYSNSYYNYEQDTKATIDLTIGSTGKIEVIAGTNIRGVVPEDGYGKVAVGVLASDGINLVNGGVISAKAQTSGGYELRYAIYSGWADKYTRSLENAGYYTLIPSAVADRITLTSGGSILGNVALNGGDDVFSMGGAMEGFVDMGAGKDAVNVTADWTNADLIFGAGGSDVLNVADGVKLSGKLTLGGDILTISGNGDFTGLTLDGAGTFFVLNNTLNAADWIAKYGIQVGADVTVKTLTETSIVAVVDGNEKNVVAAGNASANPISGDAEGQNLNIDTLTSDGSSTALGDVSTTGTGNVNLNTNIGSGSGSTSFNTVQSEANVVLNNQSGTVSGTSIGGANLEINNAGTLNGGVVDNTEQGVQVSGSDVVISNDGHLNANITATGKVTITRNTNVNTLKGSIDGTEIEVTSNTGTVNAAFGSSTTNTITLVNNTDAEQAGLVDLSSFTTADAGTVTLTNDAGAVIRDSSITSGTVNLTGSGTYSNLVMDADVLNVTDSVVHLSGGTLGTANDLGDSTLNFGSADAAFNGSVAAGVINFTNVNANLGALASIGANADGYAFKVNNLNLTNAGTVTGTSFAGSGMNVVNSGSMTGTGNILTSTTNSTIVNEENGVISTSGKAALYFDQETASALSLTNHGEISGAYSAVNFWGFTATDVQDFLNKVNTVNTVVNTGIIKADAMGFFLVNGNFSINNSGLIIGSGHVPVGNDGAENCGIAVEWSAVYNFDPYRLITSSGYGIIETTNSGTIFGDDYGIKSADWLDVNNTGNIGYYMDNGVEKISKTALYAYRGYINAVNAEGALIQGSEYALYAGFANRALNFGEFNPYSWIDLDNAGTVKGNVFAKTIRIQGEGSITGNITSSGTQAAYSPEAPSISFVGAYDGKAQTVTGNISTDGAIVFDGGAVKLSGTVSAASITVKVEDLAAYTAYSFAEVDATAAAALMALNLTIVDKSIAAVYGGAGTGVLIGDKYYSLVYQNGLVGLGFVDVVVTTSQIFVDASWSGKAVNEIVTVNGQNYVIGVNAFSDLRVALTEAAKSTENVTVTVNSDCDLDLSSDLMLAPKADITIVSGVEGGVQISGVQPGGKTPDQGQMGIYIDNNGTYTTFTIGNDVSLNGVYQFMPGSPTPGWGTTEHQTVILSGELTAAQFWTYYSDLVITETGKLIGAYGDGMWKMRGNGTIAVTGTVADTSADLSSLATSIQGGYISVDQSGTRSITATNAYLNVAQFSISSNTAGSFTLDLTNSILKVDSVANIANSSAAVQWNLKENSRLILATNLTLSDPELEIILSGSSFEVKNVLTNAATIRMDYTSTLSFGSIVNTGTVSVDMTGFTDGVYRLIVNKTAYTEADYKALLGEANWNESYTVIENTLFAANVNTSIIYADSAWSTGYQLGDSIALPDGTTAYYKFNAFGDVAKAFDSQTAETQKLKLIGDHSVITDSDGVIAEKRNFNVRVTGNYTITASEGTASTLKFIVKESSWTGGGSTSEVGELAFFSASDDSRATVTIDAGVTLETNAKLWFGRSAVTKEVHATDFIINGNIIQQTVDNTYGIMQIQIDKGSTLLLNGSMSLDWLLAVRGSTFTVSSTGELKKSPNSGSSIVTTVQVDARDEAAGRFIIDGSKKVNLNALKIFENSSAELKNGAEVSFDTVTVNGLGSLTLDNSILTVDQFNVSATGSMTVSASTVTVNGTFVNQGSVSVSGGADITVGGDVTVGTDGLLNTDFISMFSFSGAFNNNGTITVDMNGATEALYKIMDYTGVGTVAGYGNVTFVNNDGNYHAIVIDNDLYVGRIHPNILVNSAYGPDNVPEGYLFGVNAFNTLAGGFAAGASSGFDVIVNGGTFIGDVAAGNKVNVIIKPGVTIDGLLTFSADGTMLYVDAKANLSAPIVMNGGTVFLTDTELQRMRMALLSSGAPINVSSIVAGAGSVVIQSGDDWVMDATSSTIQQLSVENGTLLIKSDAELPKNIIVGTPTSIGNVIYEGSSMSVGDGETVSFDVLEGSTFKTLNGTPLEINLVPGANATIQIDGLTEGSSDLKINTGSGSTANVVVDPSVDTNKIINTGSGDVAIKVRVTWPDGFTGAPSEVELLKIASGETAFSLSDRNKNSGALMDTSISINLYGGGVASQPGNDDPAYLYVNNVTYNWLFGGSNAWDTPNKDSYVFVEDSSGVAVYGGGESIMFHGTVYGASMNNATTYVKNSDHNAVIGGGRGSGADVQNATLTIDGGRSRFVYGGGYGANTATANLEIKGGADVDLAYGGGAGGNAGTVNFTISGEKTVVSKVYGGGSGNVTVNNINLILNNKATVDSVYGGGDFETHMVHGNIDILVDNADVTTALYGVGRSNMGTDSLVTVTLQNGADVNELYGGAYSTTGAADSFFDINDIIVNVSDSTVGSLYGAGRATLTDLSDADDIANVKSVVVSLNAGSVVTDSVYGGAFLNSSDTVALKGGFVIESTEVNIGDGAQIGQGVVGGSFVTNGSVLTETSVVNFNGGSTLKIYGGDFISTSRGENAFAQIDHVFVNMNATSDAVVHGGSIATQGSANVVNSTITVASGVVLGDVYAGGYGNNSSVTNGTVVLKDGSSVNNLVVSARGVSIPGAGVDSFKLVFDGGMSGTSMNLNLAGHQNGTLSFSNMTGAADWSNKTVTGGTFSKVEVSGSSSVTLGADNLGTLTDLFFTVNASTVAGSSAAMLNFAAGVSAASVGAVTITLDNAGNGDYLLLGNVDGMSASYTINGVTAVLGGDFVIVGNSMVKLVQTASDALSMTVQNLVYSTETLLVDSTLGSEAVVRDGNAYKIGENAYTALSAAEAAVGTGKTIRLDSAETAGLASSKVFTLENNAALSGTLAADGVTLDGTGSYEMAVERTSGAFLANGTDFTLTALNGTDTVYAGGMSALASSDLTLNGATVTDVYAGGDSVSGTVASAVVTMTSGNITNIREGNADSSVIYLNGGTVGNVIGNGASSNAVVHYNNVSAMTIDGVKEVNASVTLTQNAQIKNTATVNLASGVYGSLENIGVINLEGFTIGSLSLLKNVGHLNVKNDCSISATLDNVGTIQVADGKRLAFSYSGKEFILNTDLVRGTNSFVDATATNFYANGRTLDLDSFGGTAIYASGKSGTTVSNADLTISNAGYETAGTVVGVASGAAVSGTVSVEVKASKITTSKCYAVLGVEGNGTVGTVRTDVNPDVILAVTQSAGKLTSGLYLGIGNDNKIYGSTKVALTGDAQMALNIEGNHGWSESLVGGFWGTTAGNEIFGNTAVEITGNSSVVRKGTTYGNEWGGNILGGGSGTIHGDSSVRIDTTGEINLKGGSIIGGSSWDGTVVNSSVTVNNGTITIQQTEGAADVPPKRAIYGGSYGNSVTAGNATVSINGGTVNANIYAGSRTTNVGGNATVNLNGGSITGMIAGNKDRVTGTSTLNLGGSTFGAGSSVTGFDQVNVNGNGLDFSAVDMSDITNLGFDSGVSSAAFGNVGFDDVGTTLNFNAGTFSAERIAMGSGNDTVKVQSATVLNTVSGMDLGGGTNSFEVIGRNGGTFAFDGNSITNVDQLMVNAQGRGREGRTIGDAVISMANTSYDTMELSITVCLEQIALYSNLNSVDYTFTLVSGTIPAALSDLSVSVKWGETDQEHVMTVDGGGVKLSSFSNTKDWYLWSADANNDGTNDTLMLSNYANSSRMSLMSSSLESLGNDENRMKNAALVG